MSIYPASSLERDRWILARRPERNRLDPRRAYHVLHEQEPGPGGALQDVATVFLTNRECPFRCLMCDLWRNTLEETVPAGAIAVQLRQALAELPPARVLKLYNAGSLFDPRAIPPDEYAEIAGLAEPFERVVVESHPAFLGPGLGERCLQFQDFLSGKLEVAMGLETVHPVVLPRLNKRMTLPQFRAAADWLRQHGMDLRVFILVRPPWLSEAEGLEWAQRSLHFAAECGASVSAVIPTRAGNGAMEALRESGEWSPPTLRSLEAALAYGLQLRAGRIFADLWDVEQFASCQVCAPERIARLAAMNQAQQLLSPVHCEACGETSG